MFQNKSEMEIDKSCRICGDSGQYDIFESEMKVADNKTVKIYIILNNFLYEKLYAPDEYSSMICGSCCDSMINSYSFMMHVRESERILRQDGHLPKPPPKKKQKLESPAKKIDLIADECDAIYEDDIIEEEQLSADIDTTPAPPPPTPVKSIPAQHSQVINSLKKEIVKRQKLTNITKPVKEDEQQKSITISDYKLVVKNETEEQKTMTMLFLSKSINTATDDFNFDEYQPLTSQQNDGSIYSCNYCVKAFSNCDLLLKHVTSCHVCLLCFKIFKNGYKELSDHNKTHADEKFQCSLCLKFFTQSLYRQHIKKNHFPRIPNFVSVRPATNI